MAQFDVYKNPRGGVVSFFVDLQSEVLDRLTTRVVAPLVSTKRYGTAVVLRLHPVVTIKNGSYLVLLQELAGIDASLLGQRVASLAARRSDLIAALDLLFTGA